MITTSKRTSDERIEEYKKFSMLKNCIIKHIGDGDPENPMFYADGDTGVITANLDGYAIVPREEYERLLEEKK